MTAQQIKDRTAELIAQGMRRPAAHQQANREAENAAAAQWRATLPADEQ